MKRRQFESVKKASDRWDQLLNAEDSLFESKLEVFHLAYQVFGEDLLKDLNEFIKRHINIEFSETHNMEVIVYPEEIWEDTGSVIKQ